MASCSRCGAQLSEDGNCPDCTAGQPATHSPGGRPWFILALAVPGLVLLPLAIAAVVLGGRYRREAEHGRLPQSRIARLGFALGGAGIIVGVIQVCAFLYLLPARDIIAVNEALAMSTLRDIYNAQSRHIRLTGSYADSLKLLRKRAFLDMADPEYSAYRFELTVFENVKEYECRAHPAKPGISGWRHFYIDHSGTLRESDLPRVGRDSPRVDSGRG